MQKRCAVIIVHIMLHKIAGSLDPKQFYSYRKLVGDERYIVPNWRKAKLKAEVVSLSVVNMLSLNTADFLG
ncbi:hypothetical protein QE152_g3695 [Popillia japonica]|uniref:Uncharacterized protein n=1 Tax=Popillia japonica TaxID=7064 RepID=A0AAW1N367_POPJA